ncbi:hypothetical protein GQ600_10557 [Phytophthora cactorum]|nr:hypothetical protein GQ600_10557 [Phytophthora cactorum]
MSRDLYAAYERQERKRSHEQIQAETHGFTLNTKQKPIKTSDVVSLMPQATDEDVELSLRLKLAVDMKEKLSRLDVFEVVSLMTTQQHLVMQLAEALLHTSNIPLQQLFFMSLTSLLSTMNSRPSEQTANVRERLCDSLGHLDKILLRVLPVDEVIEVIDQIPIAVDKWLDFGETLLTFYHQLPQETILYNLPYKCQETLEFDEDRGLALISIKRVFGLDGINLVAFGVDSTVRLLESIFYHFLVLTLENLFKQEFAEFRDTLCAFKPGSVQILPTADPERVRSTLLLESALSFDLNCLI